jgi:hypothetical protein
MFKCGDGNIKMQIREPIKHSHTAQQQQQISQTHILAWLYKEYLFDGLSLTTF